MCQQRRPLPVQSTVISSWLLVRYYVSGNDLGGLLGNLLGGGGNRGNQGGGGFGGGGGGVVRCVVLCMCDYGSRVQLINVVFA